MLTPANKWYKGAAWIVNHLGYWYPYPAGISSNHKTFYTEHKEYKKESPFNVEIEKRGWSGPDFSFEKKSTNHSEYVAHKIVQ